MGFNQFKVGDVVWWFSNDIVLNKFFFPEDIFLCTRILDIDFLENARNISREFNINGFFRSKKEAIDTMVKHLESLRYEEEQPEQDTNV